MNLIEALEEKVYDWPAPFGVILLFFLIVMLIPFALLGVALGVAPWVAIYYVVRWLAS